MESSETKEHSGATFVDVDFSNQDFSGRTFEDCTFDKCDLKNANFTRCRLIETSATLSGAAFENCKLLGIQWVQLATLVNPSFSECNLNYCNFVGLKLISQANLTECDLKDSDLLNARFNNTSLLRAADLRGATHYLIDPIGNKVRGARFSLPEAQGLLAGLGIVLE